MICLSYSNISLALWFTIGLNSGVYGLAWATAIVSIVEVGILFTIMARRIRGLFDKIFMHAIARMASVTGFMAVVTYICVSMLPLSATDQSFLASFPKFGLIVTVSLMSYVIFSWMIKLPEANPIIARFKKILFVGIRR